jgi:HEAT repeat protein
MPLSRDSSRSIPKDYASGLAALRAALDARSIDDLIALLVGQTDPLVTETALTQLARLDGAFATEALIRLMREGDTALRNGAIETLGSLGERAVDALAPLFVDAGADTDARIYALTALALVASSRAAKLALDVALNDADVNVCAAAVDVVAESGVREMAAALEQVAARFPDRPYLAFAAGAAQHRLG